MFSHVPDISHDLCGEVSHDLVLRTPGSHGQIVTPDPDKMKSIKVRALLNGILQIYLN